MTIPILLDSVISELHWTFGEFLTPMQEVSITYLFSSILHGI